MVCLMHQSPTYGHLLMPNGSRPTAAVLARLTGGSEAEVTALVAELEAAAVFSRAGDGVIFCRRMVRDETRRIQAIEDGKKGGNPKIGGVKGRVKGWDNHTNASEGLSPIAIGHEPPPEPKPEKQPQPSQANEAVAVAGVSSSADSAAGGEGGGSLPLMIDSLNISKTVRGHLSDIADLTPKEFVDCYAQVKANGTASNVDLVVAAELLARRSIDIKALPRRPKNGPLHGALNAMGGIESIRRNRGY